ncbi:hypothetical protein [Micromonospora sp. NPDC049107]|uniref:hypothetical protein n=1 Tax=unclassified Micromonospora TaxID=2617518 RepID=UPI003404027B
MTWTLNYPLIRARASEIGIAEVTFRQLTGLRLADLHETLEHHRDVSLALLARLGEVLDLGIADLVLDTDTTAPASPAAATPGDAQLLLALLLSYGVLTVDQLLDLLGWTRERLHTATTAGQELLAGGPMRLAVTDQHLACLIHPGAVPDDIRARFTDSQRLLAPLTGHEAHEVLRLVHEHVLRPFGDQHGNGPADLLSALADRDLVTDVVPDVDQPHRVTARPHPDVLLALRLTETPAAADPVDRSGSS